MRRIQITDKILGLIHKEKHLNTKITEAWGYETKTGVVYR